MSSVVPTHLYHKARKERDGLKRELAWIKEKLNGVPIITVGTHPMYDIDPDSYNELANEIIGSIDDHLEELETGEDDP